MSAGVAHADPSFVIAESQARAGDAVHFSITGADGDDDLTYELEVADRTVLEGAAEGNVSGSFTMPDLGGSAKSVTVEADIREDDDKTTVKRKLQYLGPALPPAPPEPQQAAAEPAPQQTAAAVPAPSRPSAAAEAPAAPAAKAKQRAKAKRAKRRQRRTRRAVVQHREKQATEDSPARAKKRSRRKAARTAPLFDGVPEPGSSRYPVLEDEPEAREAKPLRTLLAAANRSKDGEHATAILIPGLLGLAGFMLAGAVLLRKRRTR